MKRKIVSLVLGLMIGVVGLALAGCGNVYSSLTLSTNIEDELVLVLDEEGSETKSFIVNIENYKSSISNDIYTICPDNLIKIESVEDLKKGKTKITVSALKGGRSVITCTLLDGGQKIDIPLYVKVPVSELQINENEIPYCIRGEKTKFNTENLFNFTPANTTCRDLKYYYKSGVTEIEISEDGFDASVLPTEIKTVDIIAKSLENEEVSYTFSVNIYNPITDYGTCVINEDGDILSITKNSVLENYNPTFEIIANNQNTSQKILVLYALCEEEKLNFSPIIFTTNNIGISYQNEKIGTLANGSRVHLFYYKISCLNKTDITETFNFKLGQGVNEAFYKNIAIDFDIKIVPEFLQINEYNEGYYTQEKPLLVYTNATQSSRGVAMSLSIFPTNSFTDYQNIKISKGGKANVVLYNTNRQVVFDSTKNDYVIIKGDTMLYAKGSSVSGDDGDTCSIIFECDVSGYVGLPTIASYSVNLKMVVGATDLVLDNDAFTDVNMVDGILMIPLNEETGGAEDHLIPFKILPTGSENDQYWVNTRSTNINIETTSENVIKITALELGAGYFDIALANGVSKTIYYQVYSPLKNGEIKLTTDNKVTNSVVRDTTYNSLNSLVSMIISQKNSDNDKVPLYITTTPFNANIFNLKVVSASGANSKINIVKENDVFYLTGLAKTSNNDELFKENLFIYYEYYNSDGTLGKNYTENNGALLDGYAFSVGVMVPIQGFAAVNSEIVLAEPSTVGIYRTDLTQSVIDFVVNPSNASILTDINSHISANFKDKNIVSGNALIKNDYLQYNKLTSVISRQGTVEYAGETYNDYLTIVLTDEDGVQYSTSIKIVVKKHEVCKKIILQNVQKNSVGDYEIRLSSLRNNFTILSSISNISAFNQKLRYTFTANSGYSAYNDLINISETGEVSLSKTERDGGMVGTIRVATEDSFYPNVNAKTYVDIRVVVEDGKTKDTAFSISTAEEFLNISNNLSKHYLISNVINLSDDFIGFGSGEFVGGLYGANDYAIINNINLVGPYIFKKIGVNAIIENIKFIGCHNYTINSAGNYGFLTGENLGTVSNVCITLGESQINISQNAEVSQINTYTYGVLSGVNSGLIFSGSENIEAKTPLVRYSNSTKAFNISCLNSMTDDTLYTGGIIGQNTSNGKLIRYSNNTSFNKSNYSCLLNINIFSETRFSNNAVGMAVGLNNGTVTNVYVDGKITGINLKNIGGAIGINTGINAIVKNCLSNVYVTGDEYVGGFVGTSRDNSTIEYCKVELYDFNRGQYLVSGNTCVAGFVGVMYASISNCYYKSFVVPNGTSVRASSNEGIVGDFYALKNISEATDCYTNAQISTNSDSLLNSIKSNYENVNIVPIVPDQINLTIEKNNMDSTNEGSELVVYLTYYQAKYATQQNLLTSLNTVSLSDYINNNGLGGAYTECNSNLLQNIGGDQYLIKGSGVACVSFKTYYNASSLKNVYFYINNYTNIIQLIDNDENILLDTDILDSRVYDIRVNEEETLYKKLFSNITIDTTKIDLIPSSNIRFDSLNSNYIIDDNGSYITIKVLNSALGTNQQLAINYKFNYVSDVNINNYNYRFINDTEFDEFNYTLFLNAYMGIKEFKLDAQSFNMGSDENLRIGFIFDSNYPEEQIIAEVYSNDITAVVVQDGSSGEIIISSKPNASGEYLIEVSDSRNKVIKNILVNILNQQVQKAVVSYFAQEKIVDDISKSIEQTIITPGKDGYIKIELLPLVSEYKEVTIINASSNDKNILMSLVNYRNNSFSYNSNSEVVTNGIKISKSSLLNSHVIYLKTFLSTDVANESDVALEIYVDGQLLYVKHLLTKYDSNANFILKGVKSSVNSSETVYLARGCTYELELEYNGFIFDELVIESSSNNLNIIKNSESLTYSVLVKSNATLSQNIRLSIYGHRSYLENTYVSAKKQVIIKVVSFVVNGLHTFNSEIQNNSEVVSVAVNSGYMPKIVADTVSDIECLSSSNTTKQEVKDYLEALNEYFTIEAYLGNTKIKEYNDYFNYDDFYYDKRIVPLRVGLENTELYFIISFKTPNFSSIESNGIENIKIKLIIKSHYVSTEESKIPIYTYEEFANMQENEHYILLNDISLPKNYVPITTKIGGFDGNNHEIRISSSMPAVISTSTIYYGLFAQIAENTIIQNVIVHIGYGISFELISSNVYFGFIAGENAGIITNCEIKGYSNVRIIVNESQEFDGDKLIGGIAGSNEGYITNCRVKIPKLQTTGGNLAGLVSENSNKIASSYVLGCTLINSSTKASSQTSGLVNNNMTNSQITGSYVKGVNNAVFSGNTVEIYSGRKVSAFVSVNDGYIVDCLADIYLRSGESASGFVLENNSNGYIKNCVSTCSFNNPINTNHPFIGHTNGKSNNKGKFENCYISKILNSWYTYRHEDGIIVLNEFQDMYNFESYPTLDFDFTDNLYGTWTLKNGVLSLLSANNIYSAQRRLISQNTDSTTNIMHYSYSLDNYGTKLNPIIVYSAEQFESIFKETISGVINVQYFRFVTDIIYDSNSYYYSTLNNLTFAGYIEGNGMNLDGYAISGTNASASFSGFFASVGSTNQSAIIKDLNFMPSELGNVSAQNSGVVCGRLVGGSLLNINVKSAATSQDVVLKGLYKVGGIAGYVMNGKLVPVVSNCTSSISVNATACSQTDDPIYKDNFAIYTFGFKINSISRVGFAGGIVGYMDYGRLKNSESSANSAVGQICGMVVGFNGQYGSVINCNYMLHASQELKTTYAGGGIAGYNNGEILNCNQITEISNVLNIANVSTAMMPKIFGGVVGINNGTIANNAIKSVKVNLNYPSIERVGGIVGYMTNGLISGFAVSGEVVGKDAVGGIVGLQITGVIENCQITEMKIKSNFYVGGIIGIIDSQYSSVFRSCSISKAQIECSSITLNSIYGGFVYGYKSSGIATGVVIVSDCEITLALKALKQKSNGNNVSPIEYEQGVYDEQGMVFNKKNSNI